LDGPGVIRHLLDKVSRGGNLLLNVGPDGGGRLPGPQRQALEELAAWMSVNGHSVHDTEPLTLQAARPTQQPWVRWTRTGPVAHAVIDARGQVFVDADPSALDLDSARRPGGTPVTARAAQDRIELDLPPDRVPGPTVVDVHVR
jgi:alpha-L-fucosidase